MILNLCSSYNHHRIIKIDKVNANIPRFSSSTQLLSTWSLRTCLRQLYLGVLIFVLSSQNFDECQDKSPNF